MGGEVAHNTILEGSKNYSLRVKKMSDIFNANESNDYMKKKILAPLFLILTCLVVVGMASGCKSKDKPRLTDANGYPILDSSGRPLAASSGDTTSSAAPQPTIIKRTVEPGTDIHAQIEQTLDAKTVQLGDQFNGVLIAPLRDRRGNIVIGAGAPVQGDVVAVRNMGRFKGAGVLAIEVQAIANRPVQATEYVVSQKGKGKRSAELIGGGTVGGAVIGGLLGGGKGALIGGLLGGGSGTAAAGLTGNKPLVIPANSDVVFELSSPITVEMEEKPRGVN